MKELIQDDLRVFVAPVAALEDTALSANEKLIYLVLRSFCTPHKAEAFPSHSTIAKLSSLSRSTVIRVLTSLSDKGYLEIKQSFKYDDKTKKARQTSNTYSLSLPVKHVYNSNRGVTLTRGGCHTDTGGGVTLTHHEHNQKEHNQLREEEEYISLQELRFDEHMKNMKVTKKIIDQIKSEISLKDYDIKVIDLTCKKAMNRLKNGSIVNLKGWFISTLDNMQFTSNAESDRVNPFQKHGI